MSNSVLKRLIIAFFAGRNAETQNKSLHGDGAATVTMERGRRTSQCMSNSVLKRLIIAFFAGRNAETQNKSLHGDGAATVTMERADPSLSTGPRGNNTGALSEMQSDPAQGPTRPGSVRDPAEEGEAAVPPGTPREDVSVDTHRTPAEENKLQYSCPEEASRP
ncbi:unnamed protein product [Boreogadus saida]